MGEGQICKFLSVLAEHLKKDGIKKLTAESFRTSVTTQLVEASIPVGGSCEAGDWRPTEKAKERAENSTDSLDNRVSMLDSEKMSTEDLDNDSNTPVKNPYDKRQTIFH